MSMSTRPVPQDPQDPPQGGKAHPPGPGAAGRPHAVPEVTL